MSTGTKSCEARVWPLGLRCGGTPTSLTRRACVHEHIREGWLCDDHASSDAGLCAPCHDADGHECPIVIKPVAEVTS